MLKSFYFMELQFYSQNRNFGRVQPQTDFWRSEIEKPHFRVILATQVQSIHYDGLIL